MALEPVQLRPHYSDFLKPDRILLTGHSHQAWPSVAREGLLRAYADAAAHVDDKWALAMERADHLRTAVSDYLGVERDEIALAQNSHELATRFLSGLNLRRRNIVTTDGEFHSLRRQLLRLQEEGVEVRWVSSAPLDTLAERLVAESDDETAAVMLSTVQYQTAAVVPSVETLLAVCEAREIPVLLDAYHAYGAMPNPTQLPESGQVFVTGGGYKYAQWGEGCCWMRVPPDTSMRPIYTGWFSDFAGLESPQSETLGYGRTPADRFAGSTYDPASHYRASRVLEFFHENGMTMERLRVLSLQQTQLIFDQLSDYEIVTPRGEQRGGFVSVRIANARQLVGALRERNVFTDARADIIRFGPAPYTTDDEMIKALDIFKSLAVQSS